jgi:hypothetical protein
MLFFVRPDFDREKTCLRKKRSCIITDPQKKETSSPQVLAGDKIIDIRGVQLDRDTVVVILPKIPGVGMP